MADELNEIEAAFRYAGQSMASMTEQMAYSLWGAVVTTTKAFEKAEVRLDANISRVFIAVRVRWWARFDRMKPLREFWIKRAETRAREYLPTGWRLLVYYGEPGISKDAGSGQRPTDSLRAPHAAGVDRDAKDSDRRPDDQPTKTE
jgi:hypothetical protein